MSLTKEELREIKKRIETYNNKRLINEAVEKRGQYLPEAFAVLKDELKNRGLDEILEKIKDDDSNKSTELERKWWKFYLLPTESSKQIAKKGLIVLFVGATASVLFGDGILSDLIGFYGASLLLVAFIIWIKDKVKKPCLKKQ